MPPDATDVVLSNPPPIRRAIDEASAQLRQAGLDSARLDARLLIGAVLGSTKEEVIAHEDDRISWELYSEFESLIERRLAGEPVAYLRGVKEFWSLELEVDHSVLIPRPDSEILVEACLEGLDRTGEGDWAVDCGTGSGAIAVALAHCLPGLHVLGLDISPAALSTARKNVARHGLAQRVALVAGDLLGPVRAGHPGLRCIAANLPYVPSAEIEDLDPGIRGHEPRVAIDGGADGLDLVLSLVEQAPPRLAAGGLLGLEVADGQAHRVESLLASSTSWHEVRIRPDLGRLKRVVTARRRP